MRTIRLWALGIFPLLMLLGCAQVLGERTLLITEDELQGKLATLFPLQKQVLEVFNFTLDVPTVTLLPDSQRVATHMDVTVQDRLQGREYRGAMDASFALRFDANTQSLRLQHVSIDNLRFDGISAKAQQTLSQWGPMIAHDKLEGQTIYRFKPDDLARADGLGYSVGAIDVSRQGLAIRLIARP